MRKSYSEKLQDPRWQRKRLEIMHRDGFKCKGCKSETKTLSVHHSYYEKGLQPWEYPDNALHTLCADCHAERADAERYLLRVFCWADQVEITEFASCLSAILNRGWDYQSVISDLQNSDTDGRLTDLVHVEPKRPCVVSPPLTPTNFNADEVTKISALPGHSLFAELRQLIEQQQRS